ncbi:MAG: helix-turn-helix transcriptional regulator [Actinomycetales bacterium]|nr:helix-turn-helix transcriptional regulator [Actinomycetales bacterium]
MGNERRSRIAAKAAAELRAEIARQGISNDSVASAVGISIKTLRRRLDGGKTFNLEELAAITQLLGIPLVEFISRVDAAEDKK